MKIEDRILELVKEKPMLIGELEAMLGVQLGKVDGAIEFLGKYRLIGLLPSGNEEGPLVQITPRGLRLLNLPDLPEDELPSDQLEVLERHWGDEIDERQREIAEAKQ